MGGINYKKILERIVGHSTSLLRCPGPATLPPTVSYAEKRANQLVKLTSNYSLRRDLRLS